MATPNWHSTLRSEISKLSVEDLPIMGIPIPPLPLGSIFIQQSIGESRQSTATKRRLSMVSVEGSNRGEGSKSVEIVEPKNEVAQTPSRRITRSITILSDSKERGSPTQCEAVKRKTPMKISGKRHMVKANDESSQNKKKMSKLNNQSYEFIIHPESRFSDTINVFFKNDVISILKAKLTDAQKLDTSSFMEEFGLPPMTRTKDGYNPLLDDFKNTKFYLNVPTHNIK